MREHEVVVVGAGFSGIAMAVRLREEGIEDFVVLERAEEVGGTWRDNTYPGLACDVPSHLYSFSFAPNPEWSSTFSPQEEIQDYLRKVTEDQGLLPYMRFGCELKSAEWDGEAWDLDTTQGGMRARALVMAAGPLSEPAIPCLPGMERFEGKSFHSAAWDHDHDLTGERVAVIGTGASAIQFVPQIQPRVGRLQVFQRTAPWVMPLRARPITRLERALYRRFPAAQRLMRAAIYWARELYAIPLLRAALSPLTRRLGLINLRRNVPDPELRERLTPDYAPGCKRVLISNDYLPSLAQPNVEVIDDGITEVRERSLVTSDGCEHETDTIIWGTGFRVTEFPVAERVRDGEGRTLSEHWDGSPRAHRGTTVAGFPNLFVLLGPNTGLGHTSVVVMAEAQVAYVMGALRHMRAAGLHAIEPRAEAQASWNDRVQRAMRGTVWTEGGCSSWYIDRNGVNTTLWPDFTFRFRRLLRSFDPESYVAYNSRAARRLKSTQRASTATATATAASTPSLATRCAAASPPK